MNKFTPRETSPRSATAEPRPRPPRAEQLVAFEVAIKLRYADWQTLTSQMQLGAPTDDAAMLAAGAATLIQRH